MFKGVVDGLFKGITLVVFVFGDIFAVVVFNLLALAFIMGALVMFGGVVVVLLSKSFGVVSFVANAEGSLVISGGVWIVGVMAGALVGAVSFMVPTIDGIVLIVFIGRMVVLLVILKRVFAAIANANFTFVTCEKIHVKLCKHLITYLINKSYLISFWETFLLLSHVGNVCIVRIMTCLTTKTSSGLQPPKCHTYEKYLKFVDFP